MKKLRDVLGPEAVSQFGSVLAGDYSSDERRRILTALVRASRTRLEAAGVPEGLLVEQLMAHRDVGLTLPEGEVRGKYAKDRRGRK